MKELRPLLSVLLFTIIHLLWTIGRKIPLTPLKCKGKFKLTSGKFNVPVTTNAMVLYVLICPCCIGNEVPAVFLSQEKLEVIEDDDKRSKGTTLCDVVPILLSDDNDKLDVGNAISYPSSSTKSSMKMMSSLIARDDGIYDNLPYSWSEDRDCKKKLYNSMSASNMKSQSFARQFMLFSGALYDLLDLNITGLLLEVSERYDDNLVSLGGAICVARSTYSSSYILTKSSQNLPSDLDKIQERACVVNCLLDELIGFSVALNIPIYINQKLFDSVCIDAKLINPINGDEDDEDDDDYDDSTTKQTTPLIYAKSKVINNNQPLNSDSSNSNSKSDRSVPLAWQIYDAQQVLSLTTSEKRAILRASGVEKLPRPREGTQVLDNLLYDLLDESVRYEVRRLKGYRGNDSSSGSSNGGISSDTTPNRQQLLQQIRQVCLYVQYVYLYCIQSIICIFLLDLSAYVNISPWLYW